MLHWLAGQRQFDRDDGLDEPPETPAPVFAVRAFKHALFGTPSTAAPARQRRNSNLEKEQVRASARPVRPVLARPKSANDAVMCARIEDFPPSPTKGILLTPGTVGGRGKTVTFGDHVLDKEDAKGGYANLKLADLSRKRVDPFDALADAESPAETSPDRGARGQRNQSQSACLDPADRDDDPAYVPDKSPKCAVAKYWKKEYDIYRENTSREVRKLITKQKAAKGYAREKDEQCTALSEELASERKNVERLERRAKELETQLRALQARFDDTTATEARSRKTIPKPVTIAALSSKDDLDDETVAGHDSALAALAHTTMHTERRVEAAIASHPEPVRRSVRLRHDSLDPEVTASSQPIARKPRPINASQPVEESKGIFRADRINEIKENLTPDSQTSLSGNEVSAEVPKSIISREGEVIPPDRVAAARARLAARRQQRVAT